MTAVPTGNSADAATDSASLTIEIQPEPSADERDAIVAALLALAGAQPRVPAPRQDMPSRWALAGRLEAIRQRAQTGRGWGGQGVLLGRVCFTRQDFPTWVGSTAMTTLKEEPAASRHRPADPDLLHPPERRGGD